MKRGKRGMLFVANENKTDHLWHKIFNKEINFIHVCIEDIEVLSVYFPPQDTKKYIEKMEEWIVEVNKGEKIGRQRKTLNFW
jgi:uncharacterized membrane protein (UPF0127 family)